MEVGKAPVVIFHMCARFVGIKRIKHEYTLTTIMYLPFTYSLRDALQDRIGAALMNLIPQETLNELQRYFIVDTAGVLVWTIIFLTIGVAIGRTLKM